MKLLIFVFFLVFAILHSMLIFLSVLGSLTIASQCGMTQRDANQMKIPALRKKFAKQFEKGVVQKTVKIEPEIPRVEVPVEMQVSRDLGDEELAWELAGDLHRDNRKLAMANENLKNQKQKLKAKNELVSGDNSILVQHSEIVENENKDLRNKCSELENHVDEIEGKYEDLKKKYALLEGAWHGLYYAKQNDLMIIQVDPNSAPLGHENSKK